MKALFLFFFLLPVSATAQNLVQVEIQNYKSGVTPGFRYDLKIGSNSYLTSKFGFYLTERNNISDVEFKQDKGFIYSLGYARSNFFLKNLTAHIRTNLLQIFSIHKCDCPPISLGGLSVGKPSSDYYYSDSQSKTFIQPSMGLEYRIGLGKTLFLKPHFSVGYSIVSNFNLESDNFRSFYRDLNGKPRDGASFVGEGIILVGGINFGYSFLVL